MLLIKGTFRLPPENLDEALPAMRTMMQASRQEPGCVEYGYAHDVIDSGLIHVREMWRDREALDRHLTSTHLQVWRSTWSRLGISERRLVLYVVDEGTPV